MPHAASRSARARKSRRSTPSAAGQQVGHRQLGQHQHLTVGDRRVGLELLPRRLEHVDVDDRRRAEAAALDQDRLLAQHLAGLQHLAVGAEHRRPAQPDLHQLERHQPVVDRPELDALELDHVDLDAAGGQPVEQALDQPLRLVVVEERARAAGSPRRCRAPPAAAPPRRPACGRAARSGSARRAGGTGTSRPSSRGTRCRRGSCGPRRCRRRRRTRCRRRARRRAARGSAGTRGRASPAAGPARRIGRPCRRPRRSPPCRRRRSTWRPCPRRRPARKNQRATSWPAPISAMVPYQRGSRLICRAFCSVSTPASMRTPPRVRPLLGRERSPLPRRGAPVRHRHPVPPRGRRWRNQEPQG